MKVQVDITSIEQVKNTEHGGPFDRGGADAWYSRPMIPHWYPNGTYTGKRVDSSEMSKQEIAEYTYGYITGEFGGKDWN